MKTIAQLLKHDFSKCSLFLYDKNGNEVYRETSKGFWWKSEYKDGNEVYCEDSKGYWWKSEYRDGKRVYYENSTGYWTKSEYKDGKQVYFETSDGYIKDKRRTCNGRIVEIDGKKYQLKEI